MNVLVTYFLVTTWPILIEFVFSKEELILYEGDGKCIWYKKNIKQELSEIIISNMLVFWKCLQRFESLLY
jgi:hypothetical protein